ncbi:MAG: flavodoxin [Chloroflexi bacterium]|nr:flavodoxin [Chloroflexota bacterium]
MLIAYATKHGSTLEVAEAVAATLRECDIQAEVRPAQEVRELGGWGAVVLGAPIYSGRWHGDARRFLSRHREELSIRPVAIFALGPREVSAEKWQRSRAQLDSALASASWLAPVSVGLFGGVDPPKRKQVERRDARDWTAIRSWARDLAFVRRPSPLGAVTPAPVDQPAPQDQVDED